MDQSALLQLADEVLLIILEGLISDKPSLCSIARTCTHLNRLAEPFIYRYIRILRGEQASRFWWIFEGDPEKARWIHSFDLRCRPNEVRGITSVEQFFPTLEKLQYLTIESPWCNRYNSASPERRVEWMREMNGYRKVFEAASLLDTSSVRGRKPFQHLRSCTLHYSGEDTRRWRLDRNSVLFLHPTLRDLTLSCCVVTDSDVEILRNYKGKRTPLTKLTFIESVYSPAAIGAVLSVAAALTTYETRSTGRFKNHHRDFAVDADMETAPSDLIAILARRQPQLQRLIYCDDSADGDELPWPRADERPKMPNLHSLTYLELSQRALTNLKLCYRDSDAVGSASVKTLKMSDGGLSISPNRANLHELTILEKFPAVKQVEVMPGSFACDLNVEFDKKIHRKIIEADNMYRQRNIEFKVFVQAPPNRRGWRGCVPPYLYGERAPEYELVFQSGHGKDGFLWEWVAEREKEPEEAGMIGPEL